MGVKKLLAEYDKAFMSLHEVLYRMKATDNATYEEAAQALSRLLRDQTKSKPAWYRFSPRDPITPLAEILIDKASRCLDQATWYGIAPEKPESEEDQRVVSRVQPISNNIRYLLQLRF